MDKPIGSTKVALDARSETNRSRETNLGSYIADAYRKAVSADVALYQRRLDPRGQSFQSGPL